MTPPTPDRTGATIEFLLSLLALFTVFACLSAAVLYIIQQVKLT